ncbi:MAG TPA: nodulation protein NfeD [Thermomicrobiales bacterium]|nr:nodulation protein NfeD [Thermomicrobiales bacterium]
MRPARRAAVSTRRLLLCLLLLGAGLALLLSSAAASAASVAPPVVVAHLNGEVDPVSARYVDRVVHEAEGDHAAALVLTVDTPGGLDTSMRQMVQDLLNSPIPTVAYVGPSGARAASAGVFITEAANVVAMAPGTNIGAAHPVDSSGGNIQGDLRDKITNDAAAYIKGIADRRGRNDTWVQDAVKNSVSLTAEQAVQQRVADTEQGDLPALLRWLDGRTVTTATGSVTMHTANAPVVALDPNPIERVFQLLIDPTIAYLLLTIGFYAILIELFHPGALVPGVTGAICVILAFVSFATLPINWAGLLLILLAVALFVVDVKAATHGALTVAGLVCLVFGSLMLYNPPGPRSPASPAAAVALPALVAVVLIGAAVSLLIVGSAVRVMRRPPLTGPERLAGATGVATSALDPSGVVRVQGQLWSARLRAGTLEAGRPVRVVARQGLTLEVEPDETREPVPAGQGREFP